MFIIKVIISIISICFLRNSIKHFNANKFIYYDKSCRIKYKLTLIFLNLISASIYKIYIFVARILSKKYKALAFILYKEIWYISNTAQNKQLMPMLCVGYTCLCCMVTRTSLNKLSYSSTLSAFNNLSL